MQLEMVDGLRWIKGRRNTLRTQFQNQHRFGSFIHRLIIRNRREKLHMLPILWRLSVSNEETHLCQEDDGKDEFGSAQKVLNLAYRQLNLASASGGNCIR